MLGCSDNHFHVVELCEHHVLSVVKLWPVLTLIDPHDEFPLLTNWACAVSTTARHTVGQHEAWNQSYYEVLQYFK